MKLQVFDPPMCCSTGVCGPAVDPKLVGFAADLEWLARHGVEVQRFNLSQQPAAFVENAAVKAELARHANDCLPLVLLDGEIMTRGRYPTRPVLAWFTGLAESAGLFTESVKELVAIGASIAANCEPCFEFHEAKARKLGVSDADMWQAVEMAQMVKETPARAVLKLADSHLRHPADEAARPEAKSSEAESCCGGDMPAMPWMKDGFPGKPPKCC